MSGSSDGSGDGDESLVLEANLARVEAELAALRGSRATLRERLAAQEEESTAFHELRSERLGLEVRVAELEGMLAQERAEGAQAEGAAAQALGEMRAARDAAEERAAVAEARVRVLEEQVAAATARAGAHADAVRGQLERKAALAAEQKSIAEARAAVLEAQLADTEAAAAAADSAAREKHRVLGEQNERLRAQVAERSDGSATRSAAISAELEAKQRAVAELRAECAEALRARNVAEARVAELEAQVSAAGVAAGDRAELDALRRELERLNALLVAESERFAEARRVWTDEKSELVAVVNEQSQLLAALDAELAAARAAPAPAAAPAAVAYTPVGDPRYDPRPPPPLVDEDGDALAEAYGAAGEDVPAASAEALLSAAITDLRAKIGYLEKTGWHVAAAGESLGAYDERPLKLASPAAASAALRELVCEVEAVVREAKAYRNDLAAALHEKHLLLERMYAEYAAGGMAAREPTAVKNAKLERALRVTHDALQTSRAAQVKPWHVQQLSAVRAGVADLIRTLDLRDLRRESARVAVARGGIGSVKKKMFAW